MSPFPVTKHSSGGSVKVLTGVSEGIGEQVLHFHWGGGGGGAFPDFRVPMLTYCEAWTLYFGFPASLRPNTNYETESKEVSCDFPLLPSLG